MFCRIAMMSCTALLAACQEKHVPSLHDEFLDSLELLRGIGGHVKPGQTAKLVCQEAILERFRKQLKPCSQSWLCIDICVFVLSRLYL